MNCTEQILQSDGFLAALTHPNPIVSQALLVPYWDALAEAAVRDALQQMMDLTEFQLNLALGVLGPGAPRIDLPDIPCGCEQVQLVGLGYDFALYGAA